MLDAIRPAHRANLSNVEALFSFDGVVVSPNGDEGPRALAGLSLDVPDGGITAVVGPSGAGKSTMLRLCNRLEVPTSGVVRLRGDDIAGLDPLALRRRVGMVFQKPTLFPGSVITNLRVADPDLDGDDAAALLDRAGLGPEFLDRVADDLSGGEAQRCCLARTLATRPEVLLMDEPTSALDHANARRLEDLARGLAEGGVPVLWVTHDLAQARRVGDHIVVLLAGRLAGDRDRAAYLATFPAEGASEP